MNKVNRGVSRSTFVVTASFLTVCLATPSLLAQDREEKQRERKQRESSQRTAENDGAAVTPSDKKIFSGPQVGEPLGEVPVWVQIPGDKPSELKDLGELGDNGPIAIAFMHQRSRPAFGLGRLMSAFAAMKKEEKLQFYFVTLTDDRSSGETQLGNMRQYFKPPSKLAIADGGIEGPGSLGLNRLVAMTILVAKEGKVTANFALTQVSQKIDGPAVIKAMNEVSGGGKIPTMNELMPRNNKRAKNRMQRGKRS